MSPRFSLSPSPTPIFMSSISLIKDVFDVRHQLVSDTNIYDLVRILKSLLVSTCHDQCRVQYRACLTVSYTYGLTITVNVSFTNISNTFPSISATNFSPSSSSSLTLSITSFISINPSMSSKTSHFARGKL